MIGVSLVVRATVILVLGFAALLLTRRASASARSLLLAATFGMLLVLPIATAAVPPLLVPWPMDGAVTRVVSTTPVPSAVRPRLGEAAPSVGSRAARAWTTAATMWPMLFVLWGVGAVLAVIPMLRSLIAAARLRRTGTPWARGSEMTSAMAGSAGVKRRVIAIINDGVATPGTFGVIRPAVVFPRAAGEWNDTDLRSATVHELEHVLRADWIVLIVARLVCALYWCHPLVWIAWRRLRLETERACDDAVVRLTDAPRYAEQLVTLATGLSWRPAPILSMTTRSELAVRVSAVLARNCRRERSTRRFRRLVAVAAAAVLAIVAASQFTPTSAGAQQAARSRVGEIVPVESVNFGREVKEGGASLSGFLFDPFGQPVPGVVLGIESLQFGNPPTPPDYTPFFRAIKTDAAGHFAFEHVPPGLYGLAAPTSDFVPGTQLSLHPGEQVEHDVHMTIGTITGHVTVCKECPRGSDSYSLPESIRAEFERDEQLALTLPVTGPVPIDDFLEQGTSVLYPASLKDSSLEGRVVVEGNIAINGRRADMHVVSATYSMLAAAALELLEAGQWKPAYVGGVAVAVPFRMQLDFVLQDHSR